MNLMIVAMVLLVLVTGVYAAAPNTTSPKESPKDAVLILLQSIDSKMQFIPGPQGPSGPEGATGPQGPQGNMTVTIETSQTSTQHPKYHVYLHLDGIDGEVMDVGYEHWIELLSYSWGAKNPIVGDVAGGGASTGKVTISDFSFTKMMDISSPTLFLDTALGKNIPEGTIAVVIDGHMITEYNLSNILISSYQTTAPNNGDPVPMDMVTLNFEKVIITQNQYDAGVVANTVISGWDIKANKKV
jgi:type VI secretion system secreted protein Hcp